MDAFRRIFSIFISVLVTLSALASTMGAPQAHSTWTETSTMLPVTEEVWGVALGHINSDGKLDIAIANASGVQTYMGDGAGHWTKTPETPVYLGRYDWVGFSDYDGNGVTDLFACGENTGVRLWAGNNAGYWTEATVAAGLPTGGGYWASFAVADVNKDTRPDIVIANYNNGIVCYVQDSSHKFIEQSTGLPSGQRDSSVAIADFNKDGNPDVAVGGIGGLKISLGNGGAGGVMSFSDGMSTGLPSGRWTGLCAADFNKDTYTDLAISSYGDSLGVSTLINNAGASWNQVNTGLPTSGHYLQVDCDDFDADGNLDIVSSKFAGSDMGLKVFYGNGGTSWTADSTGLIKHASVGIDIGDFNNDGFPDIVEGADSGATGSSSGAHAYVNVNSVAPEANPVILATVLVLGVIIPSVIVIMRRKNKSG